MIVPITHRGFYPNSDEVLVFGYMLSRHTNVAECNLIMSSTDTHYGMWRSRRNKRSRYHLCVLLGLRPKIIYPSMGGSRRIKSTLCFKIPSPDFTPHRLCLSGLYLDGWAERLL